jgi:hypothetical protein
MYRPERLSWLKMTAPVAVLLGLVVAAPLRAQVVLTFEGLKNNETILNYYNGGTGGLGSGPGPSYGITFGSSALALKEASSNVGLEPSPDTVAYFLGGPGVVMNVPAGFTTGFSFYYAAANFPAAVTVWDGTDGTGTLLTTISLPVTGSFCNGSPKGFSCWAPIGASFSGTAKSVSFGGSANQVAFDNITIGSITPLGSPPSVPTLSQWAMILLAIGLAALAFRFLARQASEPR